MIKFIELWRGRELDYFSHKDRLTSTKCNSIWIAPCIVRETQSQWIKKIKNIEVVKIELNWIVQFKWCDVSIIQFFIFFISFFYLVRIDWNVIAYVGLLSSLLREKKQHNSQKWWFATLVKDFSRWMRLTAHSTLYKRLRVLWTFKQ